ncbi:Glycine cleavage system H protein [Chlamydiales bacterium STE3]|nr:Glycine cleavage system H protein [Chlamydiales bacterium STE3]
MKKFTESHEWIEVNGNIGTVGITKHAQKELGDIVFVELPKTNKTVRLAEEVVVLESTKAAADVYTPVSGEIKEVNNALKESCDPINHSPEEEGWLFKIELYHPEELENLMSLEHYQSLIIF